MNPIRTTLCIALLIIMLVATFLLLELPSSPVTEARELPGLMICGERVQAGQALPAGCDTAPAYQGGSISAPPRG